MSNKTLAQQYGVAEPITPYELEPETRQQLAAVENAIKSLGFDKYPFELVTNGFATLSDYSVRRNKKDIYDQIEAQIIDFRSIFRTAKRFHQTIRKVGFRLMIQQGAELAIKDLVSTVNTMAVTQASTQEELNSLREFLTDVQDTLKEQVNSLAEKQEQDNHVLMHRILELSNSVQSTFYALNKQQEEINAQILSDLSRQQTQLDAQKRLLNSVVSIQNGKNDDETAFRTQVRKGFLEASRQLDELRQENQELRKQASALAQEVKYLKCHDIITDHAFDFLAGVTGHQNDYLVAKALRSLGEEYWYLTHEQRKYQAEQKKKFVKNLSKNKDENKDNKA